MLAIVVSRADSASEHIGDHLLDLADWDSCADDDLPDAEGGGTVYRLDDAELRSFDALHLEIEDVAEAFDDPDFLVFVSRHAGETGPLLTAHHTGNFGPAEFGGVAGGLARACPNAHRRVVRFLEEYAPPDYEVGMECTHHGPSDVGVPSMFVEVGSDEEQWEDADAARAVARAVLDLRRTPADVPRENGTRRHLAGFGGGHYAPRFERVVRETDWAVGHVAADWCLDAMGDPRDNEDVIRQSFEASAAEYALVEADRAGLRDDIESLGYRIVNETWVRETSGVPLGLVERLEDRIGPIDDGLRFGRRATDYDGQTQTVSLSPDLLAEARGIDHEATRDALNETTIAFDTEQSGSQVVGPVVVRTAEDVDETIDSLVTILRRDYDTVRRTDGEVIARKRVFDPELAREAGVPEGPKFGRLSAGEPVEVDGRTIEPAAVLTERERVFNP